MMGTKALERKTLATAWLAAADAASVLPRPRPARLPSGLDFSYPRCHLYRGDHDRPAGCRHGRNHRHGRPGPCGPVRLRGHDRGTPRNRHQGRQRCRSPSLRALAGFNSAVTGRYRALVRQLADDPGKLHQHFVAAMISGDLTELEQWLDARHGPGCFASTFRAPAWNPAAGPRELAARKNAVISRALSCAPSRC